MHVAEAHSTVHVCVAYMASRTDRLAMQVASGLSVITCSAARPGIYTEANKPKKKMILSGSTKKEGSRLQANVSGEVFISRQEELTETV